MKNEVKTTSIEIRLSQKEKQELKDYCEKHNFTLSKLIRNLIKKEMEEK